MEIKPYERNAKKHPQKQIDQIKASIEAFGMNQQIVVDKEGTIIVGHGRYQAMQELGMEIKDEHIKVVDLPKKKADAYRLADNKLNESEWDMDLVIEELKTLDELAPLTGFDMDLLIEPDEKDDEVPEVPEEPQSKLGDLYELGEHRVLCGDSTKLEDVERLMDGKKADMVYTDPPYGIDYHANTEGSGTGLSATKRTLHDKIIGDEDIEIAVKAVEIILEHYSDASYVFWGANYYCSVLPNNYGWLFWDKCVDMPTFSDGEFAFTNRGVKSSRFTHKWTGMLRDSEKGTARLHPNQKPIALAEWCMKNYGEPDLIMDLFLGAGSTLIAAEKTGRICYGMELDGKYCDVIVERWCKYTGITKIKKNGVEMEWSLKEE
jgi:hypothetical protein